MKFRFLRNFALGCFVGALIALSLAWVLDETVSEDLRKNWIYIVSAGVTLLAASLALLGTFSVIENQNRLAAEENTRSLLAARAALPPVLSKLYTKSKNGRETMTRFDALKAKPVEVRKNTIDTMRLSEDEISTLKDCIKYANPTTARWLSIIIAHFQVQTSRLDNALFPNGLIYSEKNKNEALVDWIIINAIVGHLFEFSRTGTLPAETLNRSVVGDEIPKLGDPDWSLAHISKMKYIDSNGGWSSEAFLARLKFR